MGKIINIITVCFSIIALALGIACIVVSAQNPDVICGFGSNNTWTGPIPTRQWIFGSGIAYTIIGGSLPILLLIFILTMEVVPLVIGLAISDIFVLCWTATGIRSVLINGVDCYALNNPIWQVGAASVITFISVIPLSFVMLPHVMAELPKLALFPTTD